MTSCLIALLAIVSTGWAGSDKHEQVPAGLVDTIWVHLNQRWTPAPADVNPNESYASATLVRFSSEGEFSTLHCVLYNTDDRVAIGHDGFVVLLGEWSAEDGVVSASYQQVYETIAPVGGANRSKVQSGPVFVERNVLRLDGQFYERSTINPGQYEEFIRAGRSSQQNLKQ
jgi:hypothetical protein